MSNANEQRLLVTLEARVAKYERDLARGRNSTNDNFRKMERRTKQSADRMEKTLGGSADVVSTKMKAMLAPFLAGGVVVAAAMAVKTFAGSIAEVGAEAAKAGVSAQVWQRWTYAAKGAGASVEGMSRALRNLNIRADQFAKTGKGSAQGAFEALGYTVADVAERLQDPSRFIDEIIGKLQKMDSAAQLRISKDIFGVRGGAEFIKMLGTSVEDIQKLRNEAATFTDEQIAAADKIDAKFELMWRNIQVYSKSALLESVSYAQKTIALISRIKGDGYIAKSREHVLSDENRMNILLERRKVTYEKIADLERELRNPVIDQTMVELNLARLRDELEQLDNEIVEMTPHSKEFAAGLRELSAATNSLSNNFNSSVTAAANFKSALNELKMLVPELKEELELLASTDAIDKAFEQAVNTARTPADIETAAEIAARARTNAKYGKHKDILSLIGAAEGTDKGRGYNETLGYGKFTGGNRNLTGMTLNEIIAMQGEMLRHPDNNFNSSAVGRYQITRQTLQDFMPRLGLAGDHKFDETTQTAIAQAILKSTGGDVEKLRGRWEGLRNVDSTTIKNAYGNTQNVPDQIAPSDNQQKAIDLAKQQDDTRKSLNRTMQEGLELAQHEQQTFGMSASQQRIELELFRAQQEAKRQGFTLSEDELRQLREKITLTEQLKTAQQQAVAHAEGLKQAQMFFAESFTNSLSGLLSGTTTLTDAVKNLANSLMDAVLQAALLGQGPLGGLFGGGSGLLGSIFGFADGGFTGIGGKYQPAGVVHKGEYVMSAAATKRLGAGNLENLQRSALRGYASGGYVGDAPAIRKPQMTPATSQTISIHAPVTVNGSSGTPDQNQDLAERTARQMELAMRGLVAEEFKKQTKVGNYMNQRGR